MGKLKMDSRKADGSDSSVAGARGILPSSVRLVAPHLKSPPGQEPHPVDHLRCLFGVRSEQCDISGNAARLVGVLHAAQDLSTSSEELLSLADDPYAVELLSPARANLLRPFNTLLSGTVLQIGTGGGTATRFLAECGCSVQALEPDPDLAAIAAARCRNLENVSIHRTADHLRVPDGGFNFIAAVEADWLDGEFSLHQTLTSLNRCLASQGVLIAAFENALALHSMTRAVRAEPGGSRFGKQMIEKVLDSAGFPAIEFFYPFPGRTLARMIITSEGVTRRPPSLESMLAWHTQGGANVDGTRLWRSVLDNGLLPCLSDAFLVMASATRLPNPKPPGTLVYMYSTARRRHFSRELSLRAVNDGVTVSRARLFPDSQPPSNSLFTERVYDEPYFAGQPYLALLQQHVSDTAWAPAVVAEWARPWMDLLESRAATQSFTQYIGGAVTLRALPPTFVDCIPDNVLVAQDGSLTPFDFEYEAVAPIPLNYVVFRGLFYALSALAGVAPPAAPWGPEILDLVAEIMRLNGAAVTKEEIGSFVATEAAFQNTIRAVPEDRIKAQMRAAKVDLRPSNAPLVNTKFHCQLFWRTETGEYSEARSVTCVGEIGDARQVLTFAIPSLVNPPDVLRLDPCAQTGILYLFALRLFDSANECAWAWNGDRAGFKKTKDLVFADAPLGGSGVLAYSESEDPFFELPVNREALRILSGGGRLEMEVSWPASPDYLMLSRRLQDAGGYQEQIRSLQAENRALARARDSALAEGSALAEQISALNIGHKQLELTWETTNQQRQAELLDKNRQIQALAARSAQLELEHARLDALNQQRQAELSEKNQQIEALTARSAQLESEQARLDALNQQRQAELLENNQRVETLTARSAQLELEHARLDGLNQQLGLELAESRRAATEEAAAAARRETESNQRLERELASKLEQLEALQRSVNELGLERNRLQGAQSELQAELRESRRQTERLAGRAGEIEHSRSGLQHLNRELQAQMKTVQAQLSRTAEERDSSREEGERLRKLLAETEIIMQKEIERLNLEIDDIKDQLRNLDRGIKDILRSRIWRTLVTLSAPGVRLLGGGNKVKTSQS